MVFESNGFESKGLFYRIKYWASGHSPDPVNQLDGLLPGSWKLSVCQDYFLHKSGRV
jgi:hypothetical protein